MKLIKKQTVVTIVLVGIIAGMGAYIFADKAKEDTPKSVSSEVTKEIEEEVKHITSENDPFLLRVEQEFKELEELDGVSVEVRLEKEDMVGVVIQSAISDYTRMVGGEKYESLSEEYRSLSERIQQEGKEEGYKNCQALLQIQSIETGEVYGLYHNGKVVQK